MTFLQNHPVRLRESKLQDRKVNLKVSKVSLEKNQNQEQFALKNYDNANWYYIFFRDSLWRTNFCEKVSKLYVLDGKMKNYHEARELMKIEREEREAEKLANMELLVQCVLKFVLAGRTMVIFELF